MTSFTVPSTVMPCPATLPISNLSKMLPESPTFFDLSHKLEPDMQVYPGDPTFTCCSASNIKEHGYNATQLGLGTHTGTHIDAPYHFLDDGLTVDKLDLSTLVGPAAILDLTSKGPRERITWEDLLRSGVTSLAVGRRIVIIHTGWSKFWKSSSYLDHPFLDGEAAKNLLAIGFRVIAVDALSPDETVTDGQETDFSAHHAILGAGSTIVENLTGVQQLPLDKEIHVSFLPLNIKGGDGSPVRAVAWHS